LTKRSYKHNAKQTLNHIASWCIIGSLTLAAGLFLCLKNIFGKKLIFFLLELVINNKIIDECYSINKLISKIFINKMIILCL
jgi:hypothetical protein